jgi:hypothetical protein
MEEWGGGEVIQCRIVENFELVFDGSLDSQSSEDAVAVQSESRRDFIRISFCLRRSCEAVFREKLGCE